ncbi:hypothetical protein CGLO_06673 [Colletotrichum gloeosporioides Cg-14]|uniref:Uncharacterized protein n=1 Tax=Colletotrichum gloeosporioides (strain Cg-14) TaxID=1237896 RepID=T0KNI4_COLGC|nr:hypothetical protein CGLO_06673 [Colletotrichum gloeosporioides Cg-14]
MEIVLPVRKPRENSLPWPPPNPSLRPALDGRPGPETIPNDIFILIIQHTITNTIAFLEKRGQAVCTIEVAKNADPDSGYVRLGAPGTDCDHHEPGRLDFSLCNAATQKKRYRLLRIPLSINQETRKMVHRIFIPFKVQTTAFPPTEADCKRQFDDAVPCLISPQMDKFNIPLEGSTVEAVRGIFCDLLLALQNPRPADTMLLSCVQNITLRRIHYFNKEYDPLIEVLAAFPRLRSIQVVLMADPRSVATYSPSSRTFEPLPKSHSHDNLEHIKCETPSDPDGLSYWSKTQGHDFYELSRSLREKNVKIWLATSPRAEPWAELVATPDGPRLSYKTDPCICTRPCIPWDITILIIGILIKEGLSYLSSEKPLHLSLQCREKPYVFWPGPCGDLLSFRLYAKQERLYDDALAQKNRYRALRIPLSICHETRRLVHRRVLQAHVDIRTPVDFIRPYMFLHVNPGAPEFDENVRFLIFLEVDKLHRGGAADWHPESNFMHAVKYPTPRDRLFLEWIWFVHRREKESSTKKTDPEWDKVEAIWKEREDLR